MIYGRKQLLLKENEQMYDYLAVPYPEGYPNPDYSYVFNHSDIKEIIFYGFIDKRRKCVPTNFTSSIKKTSISGGFPHPPLMVSHTTPD